MISLEEFVDNFDEKNPDWTQLPEGFPDCRLTGLSSKQISKYNVISVYYEIYRAQKPQSRSRVWKTPQGYRFLVQYSNLVLFRILIRKVTQTLPLSEYRMKAQLDDAARSAVANFEEGWKRSTTGEYLTFLGYTQGSLEEARGDVERLLQDGFVKSVRGSGLGGLGIDLKKWNEWVKDPKNASRLLEFELERDIGGYRNREEYRGEDIKYDTRGGYRKSSGGFGTLGEIKGEGISYEILIELVNKTDYLLRKLVNSLENKMEEGQQGYKLDKARIRGKLNL
jgi:four helix bundle protein